MLKVATVCSGIGSPEVAIRNLYTKYCICKVLVVN